MVETYTEDIFNLLLPARVVVDLAFIGHGIFHETRSKAKTPLATAFTLCGFEHCFSQFFYLIFSLCP